MSAYQITFGEELTAERKCCQCRTPLLKDPPVVLTYDGFGWYHEKCYLKARHQFALAMKLATLSRAINEYVYYRDGEQL